MKKLPLLTLISTLLFSCTINNSSSLESSLNTPSSSESISTELSSSTESSSEDISSSISEEISSSEILTYERTALDDYIDHLIDTTEGYIPSWSKEGFKGKWNYIDGVFIKSIINLAKKYQNIDETQYKKYMDFAVSYVDYYIDDYGNFLDLKNNNTEGFKTTELDSVCASFNLFDIYEYTNNRKYKTALDYTYFTLLSMKKTDSGNFYHKDIYPNQVYLDGMYMYGPFLSRYAATYNKKDKLTMLKNQYQTIRNNMFDEDKQLYYHGYDDSKSIFWADSETGCSSSFWLRGMGWYLVSLVDCIEYFDNEEEKAYLISLLNEGIEGIMQYQDKETKMFYQLIDKMDEEILVDAKYFKGTKNTAYQKDGEYVDAYVRNYLESSGSSMISYVLSKASRLNYIDEKYQSQGKDVFDGIYNHKFNSTTNELTSICIVAGLGPEDKTYRDGSNAYYLSEKVGSNDAKGVGPFIMAYLETK